MVQSLLVLLLLLLGASASGMGSLDSSSGLAPFSLNREISPARLSTRKLLDPDRTQYGICRRDTSRPICDPLVNVTCEKGGSVGCWSCEMIQRCTPEAVGCYIHSMNNITYCGF